jgi:endonuclease/exonuclease/phosphatase family metal-dependent hydrolase
LTADATSTVRVMTWNIHGGVGPDRRHDLARVLALIQRADPDILALQEVDSRLVKGGEHPLALFRRVLGHHGIAAAAITTADGDYGQVLLSRWPMLQPEVHDISVPGREPRRAIAALIDAPAGRFFVVAAHLGLKFVERRRQCARMAELSEGSELTTVVLGDFNDWMWPGSVQNVLARHLPARTPHRTFPAFFPLLRLDRIYCRPAAALVRSWVDQSARPVSDHLPVIAEIAPHPSELAGGTSEHSATQTVPRADTSESPLGRARGRKHSSS